MNATHATVRNESNKDDPYSRLDLFRRLPTVRTIRYDAMEAW
eukprot:CAMPEP_0198293002 /NCGR_PEP_ID=MMETSP1449-20131203/14922_1 /TAXON_ID=420275 /ORGANISM="Attheya septentrionalis, Strain CCMP2084" /LENGTH=41 /DNA_ID= /DNA_START= /DNA_END= /DNA_ORIENTATION=